MNLISLKTLLLIPVTLSLAIASGSLAAQVYKTVDEDGNVTYTDRQPEDGSTPIKLPELSVIEAPVYEKAPSSADKSAAGEGEEKPLRFLRKHYEDFAIVSPQQEESVWYSQEVIAVVWGTANPLEAGMRVTVSVDGVRQPPTAERVIPMTGLERGEHTATAELTDGRNRRIATAAPITFFIRQPNLYSNRPGPRGGG
jgi:hypothetical protein